MFHVGIVGLGFMGMKRRRILGTVRKPRDFREILGTPGNSLCA
jgi:hypothetical protein